MTWKSKNDARWNKILALYVEPVKIIRKPEEIFTLMEEAAENGDEAPSLTDEEWILFMTHCSTCFKPYTTANQAEMKCDLCDE